LVRRSGRGGCNSLREFAASVFVAAEAHIQENEREHDEAECDPDRAGFRAVGSAGQPGGSHVMDMSESTGGETADGKAEYWALYQIPGEVQSNGQPESA
jgi:hypothetical protein